MMRIQSSCCRRNGIRNLQALNFYQKKKRSKSVPGYEPSESGRNRNDQRPSFTGWEEAVREEQRCSSRTSSASYYEHQMIAPTLLLSRSEHWRCVSTRRSCWWWLVLSRPCSAEPCSAVQQQGSDDLIASTMLQSTLCFACPALSSCT